MRNIASPRRSANVAIVGVDKKGMGLLKECLHAETSLPQTALSFADAHAAVGTLQANVVIIGFNGDVGQAVRLGAELLAESPSMTLVAYADASDNERIKAAMRGGFREFVVLPDDSELLRRAVRDAAYAPVADDEDRAKVVTVCGTRGGSGCTSLAVNLAAELCLVHTVSVIDLDFSMGDVATLLDLQPKRHIGDVLRELDRLDERVLKGSATVRTVEREKAKGGFHVFAQPHEIIERPSAVKGDDILRLLQTCADSYNYILIDGGCHLDEATLTSLSVSDLVFLVCTPDVPSVKNAFRRLQLFERLRVEQDSIRLIINKYDKKTAHLSLKDIEEKLNLKVAAVVDLDEKTLNQAVNEGRLVYDVNRRSPAVTAYSSMVDLITSDTRIVEQKEPKKSSALSWLFN
ncbi:AAA family ATPase [Myxococcota bacterium]|nr:AAA family ATPase [Myxococcota bacterium]